MKGLYLENKKWKVSTKRTSRLQTVFKIGVLKNLANLTGNYLCIQETCVKKRDKIQVFQYRRFLEKFVKFLRIPILKNICERLLLFLRGSHISIFVRNASWCSGQDEGGWRLGGLGGGLLLMTFWKGENLSNFKVHDL